MKMNTMCMRRGGGIADHFMVEVGLRIPVQRDIEPEVSNEYVPEIQSIPYNVHMRCRICGDGGYFNQDGKALEYHQPTTVMTGK